MTSHVREEPEGGNEQITTSPHVHELRHNDSLPSRKFSASSVDSISSDQFYLSKCDSIVSSTFDSVSEESTVNSSTYISASPKDELSVSPMSNFSRASISPPKLINEPHSKPRLFDNYGMARRKPHPSLTKAESLPSSYDWKRYFNTTIKETEDNIKGKPVESRSTEIDKEVAVDGSE